MPETSAPEPHGRPSPAPHDDLEELLAALPALMGEADPTLRYQRADELLGSSFDWRGAIVALEATAQRRPSTETLGLLGLAREYTWDFVGAGDAYAAAARYQSRPWAVEHERTVAMAERFRPFRGSLIAHRGSSGGAPENAVEGLSSVPGYAVGVEVDVRLSVDGVPVLMHDATIDRTTDGQGEVGQLSYRQLRAELGADGARIPRLRDYLDACTGREYARILVDIKSVGSPDALTAIAGEVAQSAAAASCILLVRDEAHLMALRERHADLRFGFFGVSTNNLERRVTAAQECQAEVLFVAHGDASYLANRDVVRAIQEAGLQAGASVVNSRATIEAARVDGCDYLLTDRSDQLSYFMGAGRSCG